MDLPVWDKQWKLNKLEDVLPKTKERLSLGDELGLLAKRAKAIALNKSRLARQKILLEGGISIDKSVESDKEQEKDVYQKIWDFNENKKEFSRWKGQFLNEKDEDGVPYNERMSLEEYVLDKQIERLNFQREELLDDRVNDSFSSIYPKILGNVQKREKIKSVKSEAKQFFVENQLLLQDWEIANRDKQATSKANAQKEDLLRLFRKNVFADVEITEIESFTEVEILFDHLMEDYLDMQNVRNQLFVLNDKMVEMMSDEEMDEEKWLNQLAMAAELAALREQRQDINEFQVQRFVPVEVEVKTLEKLLYGERINAGEDLSKETKITFEKMDTPGTYEIIFPETDEVSIPASTFKAGEKDGKQTFEFSDPLMDKVYVVGKDEFRKMVNISYLEQIMSNSVKSGENYRGPNLNEGILGDNEMYVLAQKLFDPFDITEKPITEEQATNFKKLLEVIVGETNNKQESDDYGDLLSVGRRIKLLQLVLSINGKGEQCCNLLKDANTKELSVESLCKALEIKPNKGNY